MAGGDVYGSFEFAPKPYTRGGDIGRGAVGLPNIAPPLFLEIRLIKIHSHTGIDSAQLSAEATPEMVRGFKPSEREERGSAAWSGGAASSGSVTLTYGTPFREAPSVFIMVRGEANANIQVVTGTPSATAVTFYWKDDTGATHTAVSFEYLIKGI